MMELILITLVVVLGTALLVRQLSKTMKSRSNDLRARFRSEYDRELERHGRHDAEKELLERQQRVEGYSIHSLTRPQYERFSERWRAIQEHFVDDPESTTIVADHLIKEVMEARGYPMGDFERRAADLSVDHARVVTQFRDARRIAEATRNHEASTEEMRHAFVQYRELFDDLLVTQPPPRSVPPVATARV